MYLQLYYFCLCVAACRKRSCIRAVLGLREWFVLIDWTHCFIDLLAPNIFLRDSPWDKGWRVCRNHEVKVESDNPARLRVLFLLVAQPLKDEISLLCQSVFSFVITPWPVYLFFSSDFTINICICTWAFWLEMTWNVESLSTPGHSQRGDPDGPARRPLQNHQSDAGV